MKRIIVCLLVTVWSLVSFANQGVPFFVNFTSAEYNAHNRNFDVICDNYGSVYIANFEGILYYDQSTWRVIHTPGISRITVFYKDSSSRIWVGGYNLLGYLAASPRGTLCLKVISSDRGTNSLGEVAYIKEVNKRICVYSSTNQRYVVAGNHLQKDKTIVPSTKDVDANLGGAKINKKLALPNGWILLATNGKGLVGQDNKGNKLFTLSEENGLCNDNVNNIAYDGKGYVWGATDNGVFCIDVNSIYSHFSTTEGLKGEVLSIYNGKEGLLVGTLQGLYRNESNRFVLLPSVTQACWQLEKTSDGSLYAATGDGLFRIKNNKIEHLTGSLTLAVLPDNIGGCYTGELNGIYHNASSGKRTLVDPIEKVNQFIESHDKTIWAKTMYGQIFYKRSIDKGFHNIDMLTSLQKNEILNMFKYKDILYLIKSKEIMTWNTDEHKFHLHSKNKKGEVVRFPQFIYCDGNNRIWQTDDEGRNLFVSMGEKRIKRYDSILFPMRNITVSAINVENENVWIGNKDGLIYCQTDRKSDELKKSPNVYIRQVVLNNDSLIIGGYVEGNVLKARVGFKDLVLNSDCRDIHLAFSSDCTSAFAKTEYSYRLEGYNDWSAWSDVTLASFTNLWYGSYNFQVKVRDQYGRISQPVSFHFQILSPFYLRWYSILCYIIVLVIIVGILLHIRTRRLLKEKMHLESIVEKRTSQLKQQNIEIEEKSQSLQVALTNLSKAQSDLIRQEKMATVGSLTKGLIDRILNPMNYINNFSHMSQGLLDDISENLESEKEHISTDNYEDTVDVIEMVHSNLVKIEEHGTNTTRILKAMEEMLKNKNLSMTPMDIAAICKKNFEMLNSYYADDIKNFHIKTNFEETQEFIVCEINADQISKTIMCLLGNSMYAVKKKYNQKAYDPEITLRIETNADEKVNIIVRDNGIGIEETILDKIFDPFFTTKTTSEAAGVGLYLSKEIILNHHGTISVESKKNEYTKFTVTLPVKQEIDTEEKKVQ